MSEDDFLHHGMIPTLHRESMRITFPERSNFEYTVWAVLAITASILIWMMGYEAGLSNGESRAYKEVFKSKLIPPIEEVQNETMADH